jgi:hypothetical protein
MSFTRRQFLLSTVSLRTPFNRREITLNGSLL